MKSILKDCSHIYEALSSRDISSIFKTIFVAFSENMNFMDVWFPVKMERLSKVPDMRLRLTRCTFWIKRWNEAMDFLKFFQNKYFLLRILEIHIMKDRFLIDPRAIISWINLGARCTKFCGKYEPVSRFLIGPIAITSWSTWVLNVQNFV